LPFGFGSAAVLTKRIKDSEKTLRNSGWEITTHSRHSGRTDYEITYNNPIEKIDTGTDYEITYNNPIEKIDTG